MNRKQAEEKEAKTFKKYVAEGYQDIGKSKRCFLCHQHACENCRGGSVVLLKEKEKLIVSISICKMCAAVCSISKSVCALANEYACSIDMKAEVIAPSKDEPDYIEPQADAPVAGASSETLQ